MRLLAAKASERYFPFLSQVGEDVLHKVEKQLNLYYINKCWADYLDHIAYIRESIHLVALGRKNPLTEFTRNAIEAFDNMLDIIDSEIISTFYSIGINENGIELENEVIKVPSTTWIYLLNDSPDRSKILPFF